MPAKVPAEPERDPFALRLLYSPHDPHPAQHAFLLLAELGILEAFYGGAGGGGKSDALLMDALRYADVPGYSALILRKTFADLALPGAIMDRARTWLADTDARWNDRDSRFTFPSGATLSFGYLQTKNDRYRYSGAEFQYVAFDELTQFPEDDYRFLFTRLRKPATGDLSRVPLRMRSASNPGGRGHEWVKRRLVQRLPAVPAEGEAPDPLDTRERAAARAFIPAKIEDNPSMDADSYRESLASVDEHVRAQILDGDWDARPAGKWVYDHHHLAAALALGDELDAELARGTLAPPDGGLLAIGMDWGEHSHAIVGWPLPGGGIYAVAEVVGLSDEPSEFAAKVIGRRRQDVEDRETERPVVGALDVVVELGRRRPTTERGLEVRSVHPPLPAAGDPLHLVSDHRYDAAGIQPMRTYIKALERRIGRRGPGRATTSVAFGAPAPRSGVNANAGKSYKAEGIAWIRRTSRRSAEGRTTGVLAIGGRCPELRRQLPLLAWADREAGIVDKGDDHGADALIALVAPIAVRGR